jgi:AbrB family looped-hinge helix DNA binding protein
MGHPEAHNKTFYGVANVGRKGQIVIPAKARDELNIQTGDTLVVIGIKDHGMLGLCPIESVEAMLQSATQRLADLQSAIEKSKEKEVKGE